MRDARQEPGDLRGWHRRMLELRGVDCCVHEYGDRDAPPLVWLHGWGDTGRSFAWAAAALARPRRIVAPDWRGFGDSGWNSCGYWFPDYLADLDALLTALDLTGGAAVAGHSMGANVAGLYAGIRPERVSMLINVEGPGLADSDPREAPRRYRRWLTAGRASGMHPGYPTTAVLARRIAARSPLLGEERSLAVAALWSEPGKDGRVHLKADPAHHWPNPVLYRRAEARACWQRIEAPVLAVRGSDSPSAAALADWCEELERPEAEAPELVTIPGAGHMLHLEQPEPLAAAIDAFLG